MISAWMLYATGVAGVLGVAALALERALLVPGRPTRWIWVAAVLASVALPVLLALRAPAGGGAELGVASVRIGEPAVIAAAPAAPEPWVERALGAGWAAASALLVGGFLLSSALLSRRRRSWRRRVVGGTAVLVSEETGPAVVGFLWPEVVVPGWVLEWDEGSQRLLVEHEREHERAGDQYLLLLGLAAVVALPWNLALWWQLRRLRLAMEVDCDARVLRRQPARRAYGLLLLEVGRRASRARLPAAAFSEGGSPLERRIRILVGATPRPRRATLLVLGLLALLAPAAVFAIPAPDLPALERPLRPPVAPPSAAPLPSALPSDTPPGGLGREPTFTPYEVKPEIRNRSELHQLLERNYPPALREAGIGGTTVLWVFIDETGAVQKTQVTSSSGHEQLDEAAQRVMQQVRFTPALSRDQRVPVWIQLPLTWRSHRPGAADTASARTSSVPIWRSGLEEPRSGADPTRPPGRAAPGAAPTPTPYTQKPEILDRAALARALERGFPQALREAGVGGTAMLWVLIDETGVVRETRLAGSSGHPELDAAAERVLREVRFRPARNQGEPVPAWIQLPVTLQSAGERAPGD